MSNTTIPARALLGWLWRGYLRKHIGLLLVAVLFMTLEGSMMGALAYMVQPIFDDVFVAGQKSLLFGIGVVVISIFLIRGFSGVMQRVLLTRISARTAAEVRTDLL
ncbi:MAG: ABC transporter ATP-binding protein, partial [Pseudomonadota bacterium]